MGDIQENQKKRICLPPSQVPFVPKSRKEFEQETNERVDRIDDEFTRAFEFLKKYPNSVTFYGSSLASEGSVHYEQARRLGERIASLGYAVITGGGPGIMEAANRGAFEADGASVGLHIELPQEENLNEYVNDHMSFRYFFIRKVALAFAAEAYLFFPGGFGTLDEFFELMTLLRTRKIKELPVLLVGEDYWRPLDTLIKEHLLERHNAIDPSDMELYTITDDEDLVVKMVEDAPSRDD